MHSVGQDVRFDGRRLCARMPALILVGNEMVPMWTQEDATVDSGEVCMNRWRSGWTVVRVGSGWGRRRGARYYYVDFVAGRIARVKRVPTKNLHTGKWMDCLNIMNTTICLEWWDGRLILGPVNLG